MSVNLKLNTEPAAKKLKRTAVFHLNSAAASMKTIAKELAPVSDINEPGYVHMKDAIHIVEEATESNLLSAVESLKDYSDFVEHGTGNMDAQPFMTPAFESAKRQLMKVRGVF